MAFIDIPLDVFMEISRDLDLQDSLHLIGVRYLCSREYYD
jgi:hypothetical protein